MAVAQGSFAVPTYTAGSLGSSATVATPSFSPGGGSYSSTQTVTISTATSLAVLCYTTDGSTPTESGHLCSGGTTSTYSTPISVATTQTVKAIGTKATYTDSAVGSATYTISASGPTFTENCYQISNSIPYTTSAVDTTGSTFIAIAWAAYSLPSGFSVTDNKGNGSASTLTVYGNESGTLWQYYAQPTVGSGHTFTLNNTLGPPYAQVCIYVWKGVTGLLDSGTDSGANPSSGTTCQPASAINPGSGTHVVLTAVADNSHMSTTQAINSGYTADQVLAGISGDYISLATAHLIQNPGASTQPTWSGLSTPVACSIFAFH
jgi:hypothetical protein